MLSFQVVINAPFMTVEKYAIHSGLKPRTIVDWISKGKIITKKKVLAKEKPLINAVAMTEMAAREALEFLERDSVEEKE